VQVLSPCLTFQPEQRHWKKKVRPSPVEPTSDPVRAARRLMTDDNFFVGVLYRGEREPYQEPVVELQSELSALESEFEVRDLAYASSKVNAR